MIAALDLAQAQAARRRLEERRGRARPVVTVGFFDGLHLGHRHLLEQLSAWSGEVGGQPAVVTFDRHPQEVLRNRPRFSLTSLEHRLHLLARAGVELALVLRFDMELASWSPEDFVDRVLREGMAARELLMGHDTALGKGRAGTYEYLKARQESLGLSIRRAARLELEGERVSSTRIREAVQAGDLERAARLLGRPFSILGEVARGEGRGRTLGFPTANVALEGAVLPPAGVYFAEASILHGAAGGMGAAGGRGAAGGSVPAEGGVRPHALAGGRAPRAGSAAAPLEVPAAPLEVPAAVGPRLPAVLNLGTRPTFGEGSHAPILEAHLLDYEGDLYGQLLEVHFLALHRQERRFRGVEELRAQIARDVLARRAFAPARSHA